MNTLDLPKEEIARAIETFGAYTHEMIRSAPTSVLLTLLDPVVVTVITHDNEGGATLRSLGVDLTGRTEDEVFDLKNKLVIVMGVEIDRRFPVPA